MTNKLGRPKADGRQPFMVVERLSLVLFAYDLARKAGMKHSMAIMAAVEYVKTIAPAMKISETEVKRILAYWRAKGATNKCLLVTKPDPANRTVSVPVREDGKIVFKPRRILYTVSQGPRPIYPRVNAAETSA
jgi:hypothetical protein